MKAHPTGGVAADALRAADIFDQMKLGRADGMARLRSPPVWLDATRACVRLMLTGIGQ